MLNLPAKDELVQPWTAFLPEGFENGINFGDSSILTAAAMAWSSISLFAEVSQE